MVKYKGWTIFTNQHNKKWLGNVTSENSTGEISTSYALSSPNHDTEEDAIAKCKEYIDTKLSNID